MSGYRAENLQFWELKHTEAAPSDRSGDIEARKLKLGTQHYWKENSRKYTGGLAQPTAPPPIQADSGGGSIALCLAAGAVPAGL